MPFILLFSRKRITVVWTEGKFPVFSFSSSLGGWATATALGDHGGAKNNYDFRVAHTHTRRKLTFVRLFPPKAVDGRSICIMQRGTWRWITTAAREPLLKNPPKKPTPSEGLACMTTPHSAAQPWPGLILRSNSSKAATLRCLHGRAAGWAWWTIGANVW